jgi:hypothetical protein
MHKLLTFLIALASIVFAVGSPASAQVGGLGFPGPGTPNSSGGGGTPTFVSGGGTVINNAFGNTISLSGIANNGSTYPGGAVALVAFMGNAGATPTGFTLGGRTLIKVAEDSSLNSSLWKAVMTAGDTDAIALTNQVSYGTIGIAGVSSIAHVEGS